MGFFSKDEAPPAPKYTNISKSIDAATAASKEATDLSVRSYTSNLASSMEAKDQATAAAATAAPVTERGNELASSADALDSRASDQYAWAQKAYEENKATTGQLQDFSFGLMDTSSDWANADRARYQGTFQPLENDLVKEAYDYANPAKLDLEMGRAEAGVAQKYDQARAASERELEGYGINPAATRYAALDLGVRTQQAAAQAAAANQAAQQVEDTRRALRSEAIGIGQKLPGQADMENDTALAAGKVGSDAGLALTASGANTMGTGMDYTGLATNRDQASLQYANLASDITGTAPQWGAIGAQYAGTANQTVGSNTQALSAGNQSLGIQTDSQHQQYQDQLAEFNANQEASSGAGQILGTAAGIATKAYFGASGGAIPDPDAATPGGAVPAAASPSQGQGTDDVNARLTAGEFVIPTDVVRWHGEKFFQNLIEKSRQSKGEAGAKPTQGSAIPTGGPTFQSRPSAIPAR